VGARGKIWGVMEVWGFGLSRVQGQSPWSGGRRRSPPEAKLNATYQYLGKFLLNFNTI